MGVLSSLRTVDNNVGSRFAVRLSSTNGCDTKMMNTMTGQVVSGMEITANQ
jgi:hypothetical protein